MSLVAALEVKNTASSNMTPRSDLKEHKLIQHTPNPEEHKHMRHSHNLEEHTQMKHRIFNKSHRTLLRPTAQP